MRRIYLIAFSLFLIYSYSLKAQLKSDLKGTKVLIETTSGNITIILYEGTPLHRNNFAKLVKEGFYDNQLFHRVIKNFMIQAGDPDSKNASQGTVLGRGGPKYTLAAEFRTDYYHKKGALAAARMGDDINPQKSSSGSQFYIVQGTKLTHEQLNTLVKQGRHSQFTAQQIIDYTSIGGTPHLDGSYTVFGEVTSGFDVLDKIANSAVDANARPLQDIKYKMKIIK